LFPLTQWIKWGKRISDFFHFLFLPCCIGYW